MGKDAALVNEFGWHCLGDYPKWFPEAGKINPKGEAIGARYCCTTFNDGIKQIVIPEFKKWFGNLFRYKEKDNVLYWPSTGSTVYLKTYDQDLDSFAGANLNLVGQSEHCPQDRYEENLARLRGRGVRRFIGEMTPTEGMCFDEQTRLMTPKGWAGIDDLKVGDMIFTLNRETHDIELKPVTFIYRGAAKDMYSLRCQGFDAVTNGKHRWWVQNKVSGCFEEKTTDTLKNHHRIPRAVKNTYEPSVTLEGSYASLAGWFVTDGCWNKTRAVITQSFSKNPQKCQMIEQAIKGCGGEVKFSKSAYHRGEPCEGVVHQYSIKGDLAKRLHSDFPNKNLTMAFVSSLTKPQQQLLFDSLILGDGSRNSDGIKFVAHIKATETIESFIGLCHLLGLRATYFLEKGKYWRANVQTSKRFGPWTHVSSLKIEKAEDSGRMWCPHTVNETVIALRGGTSYISMQTWEYDEIYEKWERRLRVAPDLEVFRGRTADNVSNLSEAYLERLRSLPHDQQRIRLYGDFIHLSGLVYKGYRDWHITDRRHEDLHRGHPPHPL